MRVVSYSEMLKERIRDRNADAEMDDQLARSDSMSLEEFFKALPPLLLACDYAIDQGREFVCANGNLHGRPPWRIQGRYSA